MNRKQRRSADKQQRPIVRGPSPDVQSVFADALRRHRAGRLNEAERLYRRILQAAPRDADSLHMLGVIASQTQRHEAAVALINAAIGIDATVAEYHSNLGNVLRELGRLGEAIASFRLAIDLRPDYPEAHGNLGLALKDQGATDEAIACYRAAVSLRADYPNAHNNLGVALLEQGQCDAAVAAFRTALSFMSDFAEACNNLGNALREQGRLDEAVASYRRALAIDQHYADAHGNLGLALQTQGRFDAAFQAHENAVRFGADPGRSYYGMSQCRKFAEADRPLIAAMTAALDGPLPTGLSLAQLHFALGKIADDLADYEAAIRHFDAANRLVGQRRRFDRGSFTALIDWLIAAFPQAALTAPDASESERPVLIVGMPRSGTTLTEQILASHPLVATGGELDFWLQRLGTIGTAAESEAVADYLGLLGGIAADAARVIDKMPYNFLLLGLVHRCFPKARFIHCRRNPIDTALSTYFTLFTDRGRFADMNAFAYDQDDIVFVYREYRRIMAHWRAVLPPNKLLEIDYERLVADPEAASRRLVAFCRLEWDQACLDFHKTDRPISTASAWQARQPIYRTATERWRHYERWLSALRNLEG